MFPPPLPGLYTPAGSFVKERRFIPALAYLAASCRFAAPAEGYNPSLCLYLALTLVFSAEQFVSKTSHLRHSWWRQKIRY
ncbi:MAG: hypothetical protein ACYCXI_07005, partial [Dethiobacteraceae bacterium]